MREEYERELAKVNGADIVDNDHGWLHLGTTFEYEGGSAQGISRGLDMEFIRLFMDVFGVEKLSECHDKSCWVTHNFSDIKLIEPLHKKDGQALDVHRWAEDAQKRGAAINAIKKSKKAQ